MPPEAVIPLHLADVIYPARHPLAGQTGVVLGFAVRSGDDVVLVDTGVGFGDAWIDDNYKPTRREVRRTSTRPNVLQIRFGHSTRNSASAGVSGSSKINLMMAEESR